MSNYDVSRRSFLKKVAGGALVLGAIPSGFRAFGQVPLRAGWVYLSSPGDAGWTFRHDEGRKFAAANFSGDLITSTVENVEDADAERVVRNFAADGVDITFATSFGFLDGTQAVASAFSELKFEHCSGFTTQAPNQGAYFGRMYQARYLSGVVAGLMTDTNKLGYAGAIPIPEVIRIANAFYLGAKSVNPDVTMKILPIGGFFDPPKARELALALIDDGADVVTMQEDTPAVPTAAQDRGVFSVSYQSDMSKFAPESHITGVEWDWGPYYLKTLELVRDGKWDVRDVYSGFGDNSFGDVKMVGIANRVGGGDSGLINEALIAKRRNQAKVNEILDAVAKARAAIEASSVAGRDVIFGGVVNANTGKALSDNPTDADLLSMDFPVEGVTGDSFFGFFG